MPSDDLARICFGSTDLQVSRLCQGTAFRSTSIQFAVQVLLPNSEENREKRETHWHFGVAAYNNRRPLRSSSARSMFTESIEQYVNHRILIWQFSNFECWCRLFLRGQPLPGQ